MNQPSAPHPSKQTSYHRLSLLACLAGLLAVVTQTAQAVVVYETNFDSLTAETALSGQDGWLDIDGTNAQGVDQGLGDDKFSWLGFNLPDDPGGASVYRPVSADPIASGRPVIRFSVDFSLVDSSEEIGIYDTFAWYVYNQEADFLGSIAFDLADLKIYLDDGVTYSALETPFLVDRWYALDVLVDFERNTWTAYLWDYEDENEDRDWITLFTDRPFHADSNTLDLGGVDAVWLTDGETVNDAGDNFMVFDYYSLRMLNRREAWYAEFFELFEEEIDAVKNDDDDGDGFSRDEEFAFGGNPFVADAEEMAVQAATHTNGPSSYLTVSFYRQTSNFLGITYEVEEAGNPTQAAAWTPLPLPANEVGTTPIDDFWETAEVRGDRVMSGPGAVPGGFLRVRVVPDP